MMIRSYPSVDASPEQPTFASTLSKWAQSFPEHFSGWVNRRPGIILAVFSLLYLVGAGAIASHRFLWADEVVTASLSRLTLPQLWLALQSGTDVEPPLFHLITRLVTSFLGETLLALRLPAIVGAWLMCMSLYVFVSRRLRPIYGAIAMLIPFATSAAEYTYEARCYGVAMGFAGAALVCWQGACERRWRRLSLAGLALALAAAVACLYYMVLVVAAIALAEALRSFLRKRIDVPVWIALAAAVLPLALHLPLIRVAMTFTGGNWWSAATPGSLLSAYGIVFSRAILPLAAIVAGLAIWESFAPPVARPVLTAPPQSFRPWEIAAACFLALSLVGACIVARLTNGIFTFRYGICVVLGAALLPLPVIRRYDAARCIAATVCFLVLAVSFLSFHVVHYQGRFQTPSLLLTVDRTSPIAIENPLDFLELAYNAPPEIASRLHYLTSRHSSIQYFGDDDDERDVLLLRSWFPIQTEDVRDFLKHDRSVVIWRGKREHRWLLPYLIDRGATIALQRTAEGQSLFLAKQIANEQ